MTWPIAFVVLDALLIFGLFKTSKSRTTTEFVVASVLINVLVATQVFVLI